jgi:hypothetical protein
VRAPASLGTIISMIHTYIPMGRTYERTIISLIYTYIPMDRTYERTTDRRTLSSLRSLNSNTFHPPCYSTADFYVTRYVKCVAVRRLR